MIFFLMIFALLLKQYIEFTNIHFIRELPIYLMVFSLIIHLCLGGSIYIKKMIDRKVLIFLCIAVILQLFSIFYSFTSIGLNQFNRSVPDGFKSFAYTLVFFFYHYYIVKILLFRKKDFRLFLKGLYASLVVLFIIVFIQTLYMFFPISPLEKMVSLFGSYFEERNPFMDMWYQYGSYVQTLNRINGFFTETAKLVAYVAIIYVPFILASIKNKFDVFAPDKKFSNLKFYILLALSLTILFVAKTSTGLVAILLVLVFFWLRLPLKRKLITLYVFVFCLPILILIYFKNEYIYMTVQEYVFGKSDTVSSDLRLGGTIALIKTVITHPWGVGQEYISYYLNEYMPVWSKNNWEFNNFITVRNGIPVYSWIFGWLAQYGIIICLFIAVYIIRLLKQTRSYVDQLSSSKDYLYYKTIYDSEYFFFIFFFLLSFLTFGWSESGFYIMISFFIVFRQYLKRVVNTAS